MRLESDSLTVATTFQSDLSGGLTWHMGIRSQNAFRIHVATKSIFTACCTFLAIRFSWAQTIVVSEVDCCKGGYADEKNIFTNKGEQCNSIGVETSKKLLFPVREWATKWDAASKGHNMLSAREVSGNHIALPAKIWPAVCLPSSMHGDEVKIPLASFMVTMSPTRWASERGGKKITTDVSSGLTEGPTFAGKKCEKCSCGFAAHIHASVFWHRGGGPLITMEEQWGAWQ